MRRSGDQETTEKSENGSAALTTLETLAVGQKPTNSIVAQNAQGIKLPQHPHLPDIKTSLFLGPRKNPTSAYSYHVHALSLCTALFAPASALTKGTRFPQNTFVTLPCPTNLVPVSGTD